jgi:hypothetical protein
VGPAQRARLGCRRALFVYNDEMQAQRINKAKRSTQKTKQKEQFWKAGTHQSPRISINRERSIGVVPTGLTAGVQDVYKSESTPAWISCIPRTERVSTQGIETSICLLHRNIQYKTGGAEHPTDQQHELLPPNNGFQLWPCLPFKFTAIWSQ